MTDEEIAKALAGCIPECGRTGSYHDAPFEESAREYQVGSGIIYVGDDADAESPYYALPIDIEKFRAAFGINEWQPIETAPKDGTPVVLLYPEGKTDDGESFFPEMVVSRYERHYWASIAEVGSHGKPSHWLPLPPNPAARQPKP